MISQMRNFIFFALFVVGGFFGWRFYCYFFSYSQPSLEVIGIAPGGYYAGDAQCLVKVADNYKVGDISIWLDGKALVPKLRINKKEFEGPFTIPTKTLSDGKHSLTVEVQNKAYHQSKNSQEISFTVDNNPLQAALVRSSGTKEFQGRTLHVQFQVSKDIKYAQAHALSKTFPCFPESKNSQIYECFIPLDCQEVANEYPLTIDVVDNVGNSVVIKSKFQVVLFPFKKQSLHVDQEKMRQESILGSSDKELEGLMEELTKKSPQEKLWHGVFYVPTEIKKITTDFGVMRITQDRGLYIHKALDIYNTPRSVIWAPQDGIVVIKNRYVHSGNAVVIDHGCGVFSLLYHLDEFAGISIGDKIRKGEPVGKLGKSGYATGYHLHWEMRVNNTAVDPLQWTRVDF